jgi:hypothetical protein
MKKMLVEIEFLGRKMGIPLHQLDPVDVDEETLLVIEDWHYWVARDYQFE